VPPRTSRRRPAAFENRPDTERLGDPADVLLLAAERKGWRTRGDLEVRDVGQKVDQLFGQSVAEECVVIIATHVGEGQYGDRCVLITRRGGDLTRRLFEPDSHVRHRLEAFTRLFRQTLADEAIERR
jgi:hypothetical protein